MHKLLRPTLVIPFTAGIVLGAMLMGGASAVFLGSAIFGDVPSGAFYDQAVGEMYGLGVIKGYNDGRFGPDDYVTRGQVAVMFKRLRDEINGVTTSGNSSRSSSVSSTSSSTSSQAAVSSAGAFHFTTSAFSVPDSLSQLTVSVVRSGGSKGEATVAYTMSGGTAIAGTDYTPTSGVLTFANNETTKNVALRFITNSTATGHRTINLVLKNPTNGAVLSDPSSAVITLLKSGVSLSSSSTSSTSGTTSSSAGGYISFSASTFGVMENAGIAIITVTRSGASSSAASVSYSMTDGSAKDGSNYTRSSGTLSFASGEATQTFTVALMDNSNVDGSKSLTLSLSNPTGGAALRTPSTSTLTILDNESFTSGSGSIRFAVSSYTVKHSDGYAFVAVNRGGSVTGTASVYFETNDSSAHNLADYTRTTGTLVFTGNETQKIIAIPLIARTGAGGDKEFTVRLGEITGNAVVGSLIETKVTITD